MAVEAYDCETGGGKAVKSEGGYLLMQVQDTVADGTIDSGNQVKATNLTPKLGTHPSISIPSGRKEARSLTPDASNDIRFKTPLTLMFKRSSSAPAPLTRDVMEPQDAPVMPSLARRDSLSSASSIDTLDAAPTPPHVAEHEDPARVIGNITTLPNSPMRIKGANIMSPSLAGYSSNPNYLPCSNPPQMPWTDVSEAIVNLTSNHSFIHLIVIVI